MPNLFTPDLFTCSDLCAAVNRIPAVPTVLSRFFETESSRTVNVSIDVEKSHLKLIPDTARGLAGTPVTKNDRAVKTIRTCHLVAADTIFPEDVQDVRVFGGTELETVAQRIAKKQTVLRRDIEATLEFHRVGAVKGEVLDADGSTVLHDIYDTFGFTKPNDISLTWPTSVGSSADNPVLTAIGTATEAIDDAMGGVPYDGVVAICGSTFWSKLIGNPYVREAYNLWAANRPAFGVAHDWTAGLFSYGGVSFIRYSKTIGGNTLVAATKAHLFPVGAGIFKHIFAPADYMETVNTDGLEFYSRLDELPKNRGYELEVQSNPLTICMYPDALRCIAGN